MLPSVDVDGPGQVGDGAGEDVEIAEEGGGEEDEAEGDAVLAELVGGVGWGDGVGRLLHGGDGVGVVAHEAEGLAVDADDAGDGLCGAGPVGGVGIGEVVGGGPDAEVGVVRDERSGGRALGLEGEKVEQERCSK